MSRNSKTLKGMPKDPSLEIFSKLTLWLLRGDCRVGVSLTAIFWPNADRQFHLVCKFIHIFTANKHRRLRHVHTCHTVRWVDFKWNWKNFQWDLRWVKEHASGLWTYFVCNPRLKIHRNGQLGSLTKPARSRPTGLSYLAGRFYALQSRISNKTYFEPLSMPFTQRRSHWKFLRFHLKSTQRTVIH